MAGVTNAPFRTLCRSFGAGLYVSEMISARALVEGSDKTRRLASFAPEEYPRSLQLAAVDPDVVGRAVGWLVGEGRVDHVDLNLGCPVRKVTRHGGGAALPYKRRLLARLLRAAVHAAGDVPVTVKLRVGIDDDHHTYLDAGRIARDEGISAVALHGRTAAQLYSGRADWATIAKLRDTLPDVTVLGNGDIWEAPDAVRMMAQTGCDGVVIGRGCLGRPWLFAQLAAAVRGQPVPPSPRTPEVARVMLQHAALLMDWSGVDRGIRDFRKHTGWYLKGYPVGGGTRARLASISSPGELEDLLGQLPDVALLPGNERVARGHTAGPQLVTVPEGWLDDPDDDAQPSGRGDCATSGG
jgi:nifR3 family TIM-barrel protein